jgi:hypothetical protein
MAEPKLNEAIARDWQHFRTRCLELAFQGGATIEGAIEAADKLGDYILKRSEIEIRMAKAADTDGFATHRG